MVRRSAVVAVAALLGIPPAAARFTEMPDHRGALARERVRVHSPASGAALGLTVPGAGPMTARRTREAGVGAVPGVVPGTDAGPSADLGAGRSALRTAAAGAEQNAAGQAAAAGGAALPGWAISLICAHESAPQSCTDLERRARGAVSAGWPFVLDAVKRTCLDEARQPSDQSWRLLAACLDAEAVKEVDRAAVHTSKTPAEPIPPPKGPPAAERGAEGAAPPQ